MTALRTGFEEATEAYQHPRLVRLAPNLYGAAFTLMKMIPARYILRKALADGLLEPGTVIAETTSGTFGLALAMQAVHLDRRLVLVSDPVIDERLYRRLTDLGAVVDRVPAEAGRVPGGFQSARLSRLREIQAQHESTFCPEQYSNPDNPRAYASVAEQLVESLGQVDCLVGPVGSGGSMSGTTAFLRSVLPQCHAIGVDTQSSVLFGHPDGHRELRGLGMSIVPDNVDYGTFDDVHWCSPAAAYAATRELHRRHALFMGPSSGAAYLAAHWWAAEHPDRLTVVMMPDEGYRYLDTVYDDAWLTARGYGLAPAPAEPAEVDDPRIPVAPWAWYRWDRRERDDVLAATAGDRAAAAR